MEGSLWNGGEFPGSSQGVPMHKMIGLESTAPITNGEVVFTYSLHKYVSVLAQKAEWDV